MKVAYLMTSLSRANGGVSESVRRLSQHVGAIPGFRSSAYGVEDEFTAKDLPLWDPVPAHAVPACGPSILRYAPALNRALAAAHADVLHVAGLWTYLSIVSNRWRRRTRQPNIISPHGMLDPWAIRNARIKKVAAKAAYESAHLKNAACFHALNDAEAVAIRACGISAPICVLPNGVDVPDLARPAEAPAWRAHVPKDSRILLFLGRLHRKKGLIELLQAWTRVPSSSWHLAIAGWDDGGHQADLEAFASANGLQSRVSFIGPVFGPQKEATYRAASAFILPSFSEGLPMTVLEAAAFALPILMTSACNLPDGFKVGAAQEIVTERDALAGQLTEFCAQSEARLAEMGQRGRQWVNSAFNWSTIAAEMASVYQWISGEAPEPDCVRGDRP